MHNHQISSQEGYIPVIGGRVWYRIVGAGDAAPLLILHGGPGIPHDYLEPLAALAEDRPVIFYDQLGCGKSDRPDDASLWRIERFVAELAQVRQALGLERIHLLGHSWGTILAVEHYLHQSAGIASLVLAAPFLNAPYWIGNIFPRLIAKLPAEVQAVLAQHVAAGSTDSAEYQTAFNEYNRRHLCRLDPFPAPLLQAIEGANWQVRHALFGQDEFHVTGPLKDYDQSGRLHQVTISTLFTCGYYDDSTPEYTAWLCSLVPHAEMVIFENSAHMAHLEETARYLRVVRDFLQRVDGKQG